MEKYIISGTDGMFVIIVHACPNAIGKFQWYLVDEPDSENEYILDGQIYESITLLSSNISEYNNKWLCCKCEEDDKRIDGCVYLSTDFITMISANQFDTIQFFGKDRNGKNGNVRKDIGYRKDG